MGMDYKMAMREIVPAAKLDHSQYLKTFESDDMELAPWFPNPPYCSSYRNIDTEYTPYLMPSNEPSQLANVYPTNYNFAGTSSKIDMDTMYALNSNRSGQSDGRTPSDSSRSSSSSDFFSYNDEQMREKKIPVHFTESQVQRRRAQNRAAQTAYRTRQEKALRELEATMKTLREVNETLEARNEALTSEKEFIAGKVADILGIVNVVLDKAGNSDKKEVEQCQEKGN